MLQQFLAVSSRGMIPIFNNSQNLILFIACILLTLLVFSGGCISPFPTANDSSNNGSSRFIAISSLDYSGLALRSDGQVVCWGWNLDGICDIPRNLTDVKSISRMNFTIK
jgi:hypothetical protein